MKNRTIIQRFAIIIVFCAVGFTLFTENVRPVQIFGLFACGAVVGASLAHIMLGLKKK